MKKLATLSIFLILLLLSGCVGKDREILDKGGKENINGGKIIVGENGTISPSTRIKDILGRDVKVKCVWQTSSADSSARAKGEIFIAGKRNMLAYYVEIEKGIVREKIGFVEDFERGEVYVKLPEKSYTKGCEWVKYVGGDDRERELKELWSNYGYNISGKCSLAEFGDEVFEREGRICSAEELMKR